MMLRAGVFTIMNYLLPKRGILSMHASANEGKDPAVNCLSEKSRLLSLLNLQGYGRIIKSSEGKGL